MLDKDQTKDKVVAWSQLSYIYYMYDEGSSIKHNYSDIDRRHKETLLELGLNSIEIDEDFNKAIETYVRVSTTQTSKLLNEARNTLNTSVEIFRLLNKGMNNKIKDIESMENLTDPVSLKDYAIRVDDLLKNIGKLQDLMRNVPNMFESLDKLEKKVKVELSELRTAAGGRAVGNREDTDYLHKFGDKPVELQDNSTTLEDSEKKPVQESNTFQVTSRPKYG